MWLSEDLGRERVAGSAWVADVMRVLMRTRGGWRVKGRGQSDEATSQGKARDVFPALWCCGGQPVSRQEG